MAAQLDLSPAIEATRLAKILRFDRVRDTASATVGFLDVELLWSHTDCYCEVGTESRSIAEVIEDDCRSPDVAATVGPKRCPPALCAFSYPMLSRHYCRALLWPLRRPLRKRAAACCCSGQTGAHHERP